VDEPFGQDRAFRGLCHINGATPSVPRNDAGTAEAYAKQRSRIWSPHPKNWGSLATWYATHVSISPERRLVIDGRITITLDIVYLRTGTLCRTTEPSRSLG
jgi:hypothetical protein